jgi:general secretion pathway protein L
VLAVALIALAIVLGVGMAITPTVKLRMQAIEANDAYHKMITQTSSLSQKRGDLLLLTEKINAIKTVAQDAIDAPRLLTHLITLLPDDTYLVSLTVQGRKVSLYGQTPNAASFMQMLSNQKGFIEVKAPIAAIRPSGGTKDTFTIDFVLAPGVFTAVQAGGLESSASAQVSASASAPMVSASGPVSAASAALAASAPKVGASTPATADSGTGTKPSLGAMNPGATGSVTTPPVSGPPAASFGGGATFGGSPAQPAGKKP